MPRATTDILIGYGYTVEHTHHPIADDRGNVTHDADGQPKTQPITLLVFIDQQNGHVVKVPFSDEKRAELVRDLTGGIHLPTSP